MKSNKTSKLALDKQSIVKLNDDQKKTVAAGVAAPPPINCNKITATVIIVVG